MTKPNEMFRLLRKDMGLRQKDIAEVCGIATTTYATYEQGKAEADYHTLKTLASFYGITIDALLGEEDTEIILVPKAQYEKIIRANRMLTEALSRIHTPQGEGNNTQIIVGDNNIQNRG